MLRLLSLCVVSALLWGCTETAIDAANSVATPLCSNYENASSTRITSSSQDLRQIELDAQGIVEFAQWYIVHNSPSGLSVPALPSTPYAVVLTYVHKTTRASAYSILKETKKGYCFIGGMMLLGTYVDEILKRQLARKQGIKEAQVTSQLINEVLDQPTYAYVSPPQYHKFVGFRLGKKLGILKVDTQVTLLNTKWVGYLWYKEKWKQIALHTGEKMWFMSSAWIHPAFTVFF